MRRRTFLGGLGATALSTVLASPLPAAPPPATSSRKAPPPHRPGSGASSLPGAARIARRYLELHPDQASRTALAAGLGCSAEADWEALGAALGPARQADFRAGRTLLVDGWVVADAEARLCALMTLEGGLPC